MGRITWAHLETKAEACDGRRGCAMMAAGEREQSGRIGEARHFEREAERHAAEALRWRQIRAAFERGVFLCDPGSTNAADVEWLQMAKAEAQEARHRYNPRPSQLSGMERVEAGIDSDYARGLDATPRPGSRRSICQ